MTKLDIDHFRTWIGREETASEGVTAELVRKFRATFDEEPGDPCPDEVAPRLLHWCLAQPVALTGRLGEDGHPARGGFLPPVPLPRRMWAGGRINFHSDLRVGETMRRVSRITDVTLKEGRSGELCFVTLALEIDADGRSILSETQNIVYRGMEAGTEPKSEPAPVPEASQRRKVEPSAPLLFRYSALTFNGHRIHYDHPYVTEVEGYPGLVVHGPLQVTLLHNFAARLRGSVPDRIAFRGQSPLFANEPLYLNAELAEAGGLRLWTAREQGPFGMVVEAEWS